MYSTLQYCFIAKNTHYQKKYAAIDSSASNNKKKKSKTIPTSDHMGQSCHRKQLYCLESSADKQGERPYYRRCWSSISFTSPRDLQILDIALKPLLDTLVSRTHLNKNTTYRRNWKIALKGKKRKLILFPCQCAMKKGTSLKNWKH